MEKSSTAPPASDSFAARVKKQHGVGEQERALSLQQTRCAMHKAAVTRLAESGTRAWKGGRHW
jgi:hypothetical protein